MNGKNSCECSAAPPKFGSMFGACDKNVIHQTTGRRLVSAPYLGFFSKTWGDDIDGLERGGIIESSSIRFVQHLIAVL